MSGMFSSPEKRTLPIALLLVAVVVIVYSPVAQNGFLNYDDDIYITSNPHVKAGVTAQTVKWAFTTFRAANYHPLTWLSHALDCQLLGLEPAAHHEVNVLLHAANAVLLFLLLQTATGLPWRSLFVAALFGLHPINVESVAWAAERKNVLSTLFFLLALHAYVAYARRPKLSRYALLALFYVLGLLSKPQVITLPFLLLLLDYWPLHRFGVETAEGARSVEQHAADDRGLRATSVMQRASLAKLILEKLPLLGLSAVSAAVTMRAQQAGGAIQSVYAYDLLLRLETAVVSYVSYLEKAVWPSRLVALYPHPTQLYPIWQVAAATLLLMFVTIVVLQARNHRYLAVGWLWFLGSLVPMIGLVQVGAQAMADRYAYIAFLGLFLMLTWLAADWAKDLRLRAVWLAVPALAILLVLGALTDRQVRYWHDLPSLWGRTLALTENNCIAHDALGESLASDGKAEAAATHFRASLAICPEDLRATFDLGIYAHAKGNLSAAIERYQKALRATDIVLRASAYGNLGSAYRQLGDLSTAKQYFEMSLKLASDRPMPMIGLGLIAQKQGNFDEAIRWYSQAMVIQPTDVGYLLIASALDQQGHSEEARAISERVARFSPDLAAAKKEAQGLVGR